MEVPIDGVSLTFTFVLSLLAAGAFGSIPLLRITPPAASLWLWGRARKEGGRGGGGSDEASSVKKTRQSAASASRAGRQHKKPSPSRSRGVSKVLKREPHHAASHKALARQARSAARRRPKADRRRAARKAAKTRRRRTSQEAAVVSCTAFELNSWRPA